jgi:hypothetical protein
LTLGWRGQAVPVERINGDRLPERFGFVRTPAPPV